LRVYARIGENLEILMFEESEGFDLVLNPCGVVLLHFLEGVKVSPGYCVDLVIAGTKRWQTSLPLADRWTIASTLAMPTEIRYSFVSYGRAFELSESGQLKPDITS